MKKKLKICIVRSMYNNTFELFQSANRELEKKNITASVIKVPGAFEIPVMIARKIKKYDGFIAAGCIIKGETPNFNLISNAIITGISKTPGTEIKSKGSCNTSLALLSNPSDIDL